MDRGYQYGTYNAFARFGATIEVVWSSETERSGVKKMYDVVFSF